MQRLVALVLLLAAGMMSLPLAALGFDDEGTENWIIPVQLGGMALVGALIALALPGLVRDGSSPRRRAAVGAAIGIAMALLGVLVFFLILNGFDGA
jgi:hypothetical protein